MSTPSSRGFLSALFVVLAFACSHSLAPGELAEEYTLVAVANDPLPTALYTNELATVSSISQSIRFGPKGSGSVTEVIELVPHDPVGPVQGPTETTSGMHWVERERRIEIEFDCPPNANCVAGPHLIASVEGHMLRATWGRHMSGRSPLRYEEVRASR